MKTLPINRFQIKKIIWKDMCAALIAIGALLSTSCEVMLPAPIVQTAENDSSSQSSLFAAPKNVQASMGLKKKIVLTWDAVPLATNYFIYMADSPQDEFKQINETKSNSISIKVPEGTLKFFKITSVDSKNTISEDSLIVEGASLAVPVISSIEELDSKTIVRWYMSNLSTSTYADNIKFVVHCKSADGKEEYTETLDKTCDTFCVFENLSPETEYIYYIEAILEGPDEIKESSAKVASVTNAPATDPGGGTPVDPSQPVMKYLIDDTSFAVTDLTSAEKETPIETISWKISTTQTEITEDTVDYYEIQILNKNCSSKWYPVATISADGKSSNNELAPAWADIQISASVGSKKITFKPNNFSVTSGVHNGILKVQRDYKHYYRVVAKKKDGTTLKTIEGNKLVSYRQISRDEFARCVGLSIADSMMKTKGSGGTYNGASGTLVQSWNLSWGKNEWVYSYTNYVNEFSSLPGSATAVNSCFKLTSSDSNIGRAYDTHVYGLGECKIFVANPDLKMPSYEGYVNLSCGTTAKNQLVWKLSFTAKNDTSTTEINYSASDETEFKKIFPFALGSKLSSLSDSSNPSKQNEWWEVRN